MRKKIYAPYKQEISSIMKITGIKSELHNENENIDKEQYVSSPKQIVHNQQISDNMEKSNDKNYNTDIDDSIQKKLDFMKVFPKFIIPVIVIVSAGAIFSVVANKKNSSVTDEEQAVCITTSVNSETAGVSETANSSIASETVISVETDITTVSDEETITEETSAEETTTKETSTAQTTVTSEVQTSESNSTDKYNPSDIVNRFDSIAEFYGWKIEDKKCDIVKFNDNSYGEIYISSDKKNVIFFDKNEWYITNEKNVKLGAGDYDDGGRKCSVYTSDNDCISAYIYKLKATSFDNSICRCWIFHISGDTKYGGWYYVSKIY